MRRLKALEKDYEKKMQETGSKTKVASTGRICVPLNVHLLKSMFFIFPGWLKKELITTGNVVVVFLSRGLNKMEVKCGSLEIVCPGNPMRYDLCSFLAVPSPLFPGVPQPAKPRGSKGMAENHGNH